MTRRQINAAGLELIKRFEGLRLHAYRDPVGIWTIGYGHTSTAYDGMMVTKQEAENLLRQDLEGAEIGVLRLVRVPLNDNQFATLVSFVFNVGISAFGRSTLLKCLNGRDYNIVPRELRRWIRAGGDILPGLIRRREAECELWQDS